MRRSLPISTALLALALAGCAQHPTPKTAAAPAAVPVASKPATPGVVQTPAVPQRLGFDIWVIPSTGELAAKQNMAPPRGLYVDTVVAGGAGAAAGLKAGDILLSLGGTTTTTVADAERALSRIRANTDVPAQIWRESQTQMVTIHF
jgi:S1-C subfamily serine protease